jgi:hypothetical protein
MQLITSQRNKDLGAYAFRVPTGLNDINCKRLLLLGAASKTAQGTQLKIR